jgi:hypothetical protein
VVAAALARDGYAVLPFDPAVARWVTVAHDVAVGVLGGDGERRHGGTWFVGVDALPNATDGSVDSVPLAGAWRNYVIPPARWHAAQLSVVFPGYPRQDRQETDAAHRYRRVRDAAHVDGLLPEGPDKRRHLREPHGFIAGIPLNDVSASPLVVWPGSHRLIRDAFAQVLSGVDPAAWGDLDVTECYQAARQHVFDTCARVPVHARPGEVILMHRHLVHGVAPWADSSETTPRMVAYFRPLIPVADWL